MKINKNFTSWKKQILYLFIISLFGSVAGIAHGVFFDLQWSQIGRLSLYGIVFTTVIIFPALLVFEYVFDIDNQAEITDLKNRVEKLESKLVSGED